MLAELRILLGEQFYYPRCLLFLLVLRPSGYCLVSDLAGHLKVKSSTLRPTPHRSGARLGAIGGRDRSAAVLRLASSFGWAFNRMRTRFPPYPVNFES